MTANEIRRDELDKQLLELAKRQRTKETKQDQFHFPDAEDEEKPMTSEDRIFK